MCTHTQTNPIIPVGGRQVAGTCRTVVGRAAEGKTVAGKAVVQIGALHEFLDREQSKVLATV